MEKGYLSNTGWDVGDCSCCFCMGKVRVIPGCLGLRCWFLFCLGTHQSMFEHVRYQANMLHLKFTICVVRRCGGALTLSWLCRSISKHRKLMRDGKEASVADESSGSSYGPRHRSPWGSVLHRYHALLRVDIERQRCILCLISGVNF